MTSIDNTDITAVILAGGMGRRMGGMDKGQIQINNRPIVQHVLDAIRPQVGQVIINANRHQDEYEKMGCPVVSDELTGYQGPLAGFSAAMHAAHTPYIVTLPCDGPFVAPDLVQRLAAALVAENAEIAVAHDGERMQPVYALIRTGLNDSLDRFLQSKQRKIDKWYAEHKVALADFSDLGDMFRNINTPEDHRAIVGEDLSA